jgi:hypothetical protein
LNAPCIFPCAAADALAWAEGKIHDKELLLETPLIPEAVFICNLPDRRSWKPALKQIRDLFARGARCLICRTGTAIVDDHLLKAGAVVTLKEHTTPPKYRFLITPDAMEKYCARVK